jgi:hypothetical protein
LGLSSRYSGVGHLESSVEFTREPTTVGPGAQICFIRGPEGVSIEFFGSRSEILIARGTFVAAKEIAGKFCLLVTVYQITGERLDMSAEIKMFTVIEW